MPEPLEHDFDPRLLDHQLGHLSAAEEEDLRRALAQSRDLAAQDEALKTVFATLQSLAAPRAPQDLAERVGARIAAAGPSPRIIRPPDQLTQTLERRADRVIRLGNLRDIVAVAAMIVLAVGVGMPSLMHMRERQGRMGCSWNLAQIGRGIQQYAAASYGSLPFVGWGPNDSWQPTADPNMQMIPNRRHVYPLLRYAFIRDPRLFVCPSQHGVPMPQDAILRHNDFIEARNVSYAYQNMAGVRPSVNDDPRLPIMADENPLFDNGRPLVDARRLLQGQPAHANSSAHRGAGENLLAIDGRVRWVTTPFSGIQGDNIWILIGVTDYTGREGPTTSTDSHLLK